MQEGFFSLRRWATRFSAPFRPLRLNVLAVNLINHLNHTNLSDGVKRRRIMVQTILKLTESGISTVPGLTASACGDHSRQAVRRKILPRHVDEYHVRPGFKTYLIHS